MTQVGSSEKECYLAISYLLQMIAYGLILIFYNNWTTKAGQGAAHWFCPTRNSRPINFSNHG